ncbi:MAG: hypothetical protein LT106_22300, partial [Burkholderiaceae bacterium]|nr:hypothetical protein [Burkholderiaceae bacterium]
MAIASGHRVAAHKAVSRRGVRIPFSADEEAAPSGCPALLTVAGGGATRPSRGAPAGLAAPSSDSARRLP